MWTKHTEWCIICSTSSAFKTLKGKVQCVIILSVFHVAGVERAGNKHAAQVAATVLMNSYLWSRWGCDQIFVYLYKPSTQHLDVNSLFWGVERNCSRQPGKAKAGICTLIPKQRNYAAQYEAALSSNRLCPPVLSVKPKCRDLQAHNKYEIQAYMLMLEKYRCTDINTATTALSQYCCQKVLTGATHLDGVEKGSESEWKAICVFYIDQIHADS